MTDTEPQWWRDLQNSRPPPPEVRRVINEHLFDLLSNPSPMQIPFKRLHPAAKPPLRAHPTDAGADLHVLDDPEAFVPRPLLPGERRLIRTGIAVAIPAGWYGRVAPRSGLAVKQGLDVLAGVIDCGYLGEIQVALINLGQDPVWLEPGMRIAQLIIERCEAAEFSEVEDLEQSARGAGGFGSSGT
jgi:dUTP pyrophosphatase